jgi:hypothetical protein
MKVSGPKGPGQPPELEKPTKKAETADAASASDFSQALQTEPVERTAQVDASGASAAVAEVTARIKAGELTGARAAELLIDAVVRQTAERLAPALRRRLRAALEEIVKNDPVLAEKMRHLANGEG